MIRRFITCLWLALVPPLSAQITFTNTSIADAFVRSLDPTNNYGGAGALSVSGLIATNVQGNQEGLLDTFIRFDMSGAVTNFNTTFGTGQWVVVSATMVLFEQGMPNNTIFNQGVGPFDVQWIADNSWQEGTGNPSDPTTDGITWDDEPSILNSNLDGYLGTFVNGGTDGVVTLNLGLPSGFVSELSTSGVVSFYMTAPTNSPVGFTFHSHNFVESSEWPLLEIVAVPIPQITAFGLVRSNATVTFTTYSNLSYHVQYNTDMADVGWMTMTNVTGTGGTMTFTDSSVVGVSKRFYRVDLVVPAN